MLIFGRDNLALTIIVPWDCENMCEFCTVKKSYQEKNKSTKAVKETMRYVFDQMDVPIKDVVFTGGEPSENVEELKELIQIVPEGKNVYINTTLPAKNAFAFAAYVNTEPKVKGINISRHAETEEREQFRNVVPDHAIKLLIKKPVRINCVLSNQEITQVLKRWQNQEVELSLRKDYTKETTSKELHFPYDEPVMKLISEGYRYHSSSRCNVCDTVRFEKNGKIVAYHKGMQKSSIQNLIYIEINDLIIDQAGKLMYDWEDQNEKTMLKIKEYLKKPAVKKTEGKTHECGGKRESLCGGYRETWGCGGRGC